MVVKLRVQHGSSVGQEIKIPKEQFVIGRGDDCHLRPKSDAISRRHCVLVVRPTQVLVQDLGSKNGTYVNGERVEGERVLQTGDSLKVGPLEFEVLIELGQVGGEKRPKVANVKEAAARTFDSSVVDEDVSAWLDELDEIDKVRKAADPDTRQYKLENTERLALDAAAATASDETPAEASKTVEATSDSKSAALRPPEKKPPGKLPPRVESVAANSRDAAAEALKRFSNRR